MAVRSKSGRGLFTTETQRHGDTEKTSKFFIVSLLFSLCLCDSVVNTVPLSPKSFPQMQPIHSTNCVDCKEHWRVGCLNSHQLSY